MRRFSMYIIVSFFMYLNGCSGDEELATSSSSMMITTPTISNFTENTNSHIKIDVSSRVPIVRYSIDKSRKDDARYFKIDSNKGVLEFKKTPDYEKKLKYVVTVIVEDENGDTLSKKLTIYIGDVDEAVAHNGISYGLIISPITSRVWLDRNLGASGVCTSAKDEKCFGDYYQWGRGSDGHEKKDSNFTYSSPIAGKFVLRVPALEDSSDWSSDSSISDRIEYLNTSDGSFICPKGYRVATKENFKDELDGVDTASDIFEHFLKIPSADYRSGVNGTIITEDINDDKLGAVYLWTSSDDKLGFHHLKLTKEKKSFLSIVKESKAKGMSVRCVQAD